MINNCYKKIMVLSIIVLLIGMSITSSGGNTIFSDDTTPPVTTCTLDPPGPDGLNGWYVSNVFVRLNATDDISGVKEIHFRLAESEWLVQSGDEVIFLLPHDCLIDGLIEFYAVDYAENQEEIKSYCCIDIDQVPPDIALSFEVIGGNPVDGWDIAFTAEAMDDCSGMERVEFYLNDVLQETVTGPGPLYEWTFHYSHNNKIRVIGLIRNLEITEEYVNFTAMLVIALGGPGVDIHVEVCAYDMAGNVDCYELASPSPPIDPGIYFFKNLVLPNNYTGYIGKFLIFATFFN